MKNFKINNIFIVYYPISTKIDHNSINENQYQLTSGIESIKIKVLNWIIELLEIFP